MLYIMTVIFIIFAILGCLLGFFQIKHADGSFSAICRGVFELLAGVLILVYAVGPLFGFDLIAWIAGF